MQWWFLSKCFRSCLILFLDLEANVINIALREINLLTRCLIYTSHTPMSGIEWMKPWRADINIRLTRVCIATSLNFLTKMEAIVARDRDYRFEQNISIH